jgi:hypothetical protein
MEKLEWGDLPALRATAESLTDIIQMRVSVENRVLRGGAAFDAEARDRLLGMSRGAESEARNLLHAVYTDVVPQEIRDWAAEIPGLASGEVFPRLIGLIGNPLIAIPYKWEVPEKGPRQLVQAGEPYERSLRELLAWCGCGDAARVPTAGMSQEELLACGRRTVIRPIMHGFSSYIARAGRPITKETSPRRGEPMNQAAADSRYFKVFIGAKEDGLTKRHATACKNHKRPPQHSDGCGTTAHPEWGEIGSPWRPGHAEGHAHRMVHKKLLADLWIQAGGQTPERILNSPNRPW